MRSPSKLKPYYPAVVEFCREHGMTVPDEFMIGWVFHVYINNQKEIDEIDKRL